jgi:hypothetical protein
MKIDEFLARKANLQEQLDALNAELAIAKAKVIGEFGQYISEFNITFAEIEQVFRSLNLPTAVVPQSTGGKKRGRKAHQSSERELPYRDPVTGKQYNGYNPLPAWFDINRADSYLLPGKTHLGKVKKELEALAEKTAGASLSVKPKRVRNRSKKAK